MSSVGRILNLSILLPRAHSGFANMDLSIRHHPYQDVLRSIQELLQSLRVGDCAVILFIAWAGCYYFGDGKLWAKPDPLAHLWYEAPQKTGPVKSRQQKTRDIAQSLRETRNDIAIFWGSQSGVSEGFAKRLCRQWKSKFALNTMTADLDDYDPESLANFPGDKACVFLVSTYGEGDPPDNAVNFCTRLEKMRKRGIKLPGLRYLAMGMGNKNYKNYNQVIKVIDETLLNLDALRIGPLGFADESQGCTEENFMDWKEAILEDLGKAIVLHERPITYEPNIDILDVCVDDHTIYLGEPSEKALQGITEKVAYNANNPHAAPVAASRVLSPAQDRICTHMEFNIAGAPALRYQTGDHLAVSPVNPDNEVELLFSLLDFDDMTRARPIIIDAKEGATTGKPSLPSPTTREALFKYYLEICALPSRDFVVLLSGYAPTELAKEALLRLGTNKEAFNSEVVARYLTTGKLMQLVEPNEKWKSVPFSLLVENFNYIQPRYYSISSSPLVQPRQPAVTVAVDRRNIPNPEGVQKEQVFRGLATNYLLAHEHRHNGTDSNGSTYDLEGPRGKLSGSRVYIHVRKSKFKLPTQSHTPIVMVAAGTGIAPFRGFLQERARLAELGKPVGMMVLFFGCRNSDEDFLYKDEWQLWEEQLSDRFIMVPCFSRLKDQRKKYVQDGLLECKELVANLIKEGAAFYVCGAASMAREVRTRFVEVLSESSGVSIKETDDSISERMRRAGLYQEDVWG